MKTRVCIYARVSTQGQDYERQLAELREYAIRMGFEVVREFSEKISGAKNSCAYIKIGVVFYAGIYRCREKHGK